MNVLLPILAGTIIFCTGVIVGRVIYKYDGLLIVKDIDDQNVRWTLDVHIAPEEVPNKKTLRLKVKKMGNDEVV